MRYTESRGLKVISRATAERVGDVTRLVVDAGAHRVSAVQVGGGKKASLAPWEHLTGFGPDAVVVDDEASLRGPASEEEERALKGDLEVVGKLVLTDTGNARGTVRDLEFDPGSGHLLAVVTDREVVDAGRVRALGSYALVVRGDEEPPS